jgi:hypothetical protein
MGAVAVPIAIVVIALFALVGAAVRMTRKERAHADALRGAEDGPEGGAALHYVVPNGQDPAAIALALTRAGYDAAQDPVVGQPGELLIGRADGDSPDREEVRSVLSGVVPINLEGDEEASLAPVRFADE